MKSPQSKPPQSKPRGAPKKEAFHQAAEAKVTTFKFDPSGIVGNRANIDLAAMDSCNARIQVLRQGAPKRRLHYHPNQDQIYLVLKGKVRIYGPDDVVSGDLGAFEGIVYPENCRYWLENVGEEETWLLHFSAFPKGAKAARVVDLPAKSRQRA
jgi:oxalate decarboxylase/phosphoglucose isomerase-like protein (cupin superfamily)